MTDTDWRTLPEGRELDALVAERVMGLKRLADVKGLPVFEGVGRSWLLTNALVQAGSFAMQYDPPTMLPRYSTDVDAAFRVVAKLAAEVHWDIRSPFITNGEWFAGVTPLGVTGWNGRPDVDEPGATVMEAICKCALAWVDGRKQREEDAL